jgi:Saxitoxin biosynthesis operon protein SxtJ
MEHASPAAARIFPRNPTKEQCKDTGLAIVLILLLLAVFLRDDGRVIKPAFVIAAVAVHVLNMIAPRLYHWAAIVWFGFSHLLGTVMSKVILTIVFVLVVTPVAVIRRMMGKDALQLKAFKAGSASVMVERNHTFTAADISKPY